MTYKPIRLLTPEQQEKRRAAWRERSKYYYHDTKFADPEKYRKIVEARKLHSKKCKQRKRESQ